MVDKGIKSFWHAILSWVSTFKPKPIKFILHHSATFWSSSWEIRAKTSREALLNFWFDFTPIGHSGVSPNFIYLTLLSRESCEKFHLLWNAPALSEFSGWLTPITRPSILIYRSFDFFYNSPCRYNSLAIIQVASFSTHFPFLSISTRKRTHSFISFLLFASLPLLICAAFIRPNVQAKKYIVTLNVPHLIQQKIYRWQRRTNVSAKISSPTFLRFYPPFHPCHSYYGNEICKRL